MKPRANRRISKPTTPVRTGGYPGDPDMQALENFALDGAGVDETITDVGMMPNEKFLTKKNSPGEVI